jgi:hypothetical protein
MTLAGQIISLNFLRTSISLANDQISVYNPNLTIRILPRVCSAVLLLSRSDSSGVHFTAPTQKVLTQMSHFGNRSFPPLRIHSEDQPGASSLRIANRGDFLRPIRAQSPRKDFMDCLLILPDDDYVPRARGSDDDEPINPELSPRGRLLPRESFELTMSCGPFPPIISDESLLKRELHEAEESLRLAKREWISKLQKVQLEAKRKTTAVLARHEAELGEFDAKSGIPKFRQSASPRVLELVCTTTYPTVFKGKLPLMFKPDALPKDVAKERRKLIDRQTSEVIALTSESEATEANLAARGNADIAEKREAVRDLRRMLGLPEDKDGDPGLDQLGSSGKLQASKSPGRVVRISPGFLTHR